MDLEMLSKLSEEQDTKVLLYVLDGLGGLPDDDSGLTELEAANTPNMDRLAEEGICGLQVPVASGITPGSGPGHLGLFGYNPLKYIVGRGVLSALGINFDLQPGDVAARGNFCTVDENGIVQDRRAGRIPSEKGEELCALLSEKVQIDDVEVFIKPVKEYRYLLVLRGEGLSGEIEDTDPQDVGEAPLDPRPRSPEAEKTAEYVRQFIEQAKEILAEQHPANMVLTRGFSTHPDWPDFEEVYKLRAAAFAQYPMYRGVAKLVGMQVEDAGKSLEEEMQAVRNQWDNYDFFFVHVKPTDSAGEDGDYDKKKAIIEKADELLAELLELDPDVVLVTGDHSTPSQMKYHGFQPVPVVLRAKYCRPDEVKRFGETACRAGGLGPRIPSYELMPLAMANAGRLEKFGA
ncbi:MAG: 2,3-bisphosphoglycerate-independent phosphoglycerate mutase [Anaerolineales bacterium]